MSGDVVERLRPRCIADEPLARAVVSNDQTERRAAVSAYLVANNALKSDAVAEIERLTKENHDVLKDYHKQFKRAETAISEAYSLRTRAETAERLLAEARAALRESLTALEEAEDRDERARFRANSPRQDQEVRHLRTSAIRTAARTLTNGGENGR